METHVVTLTCRDRPGIVHAVTGALLQLDGNIVENAQFSDLDSGIFCMRTVASAATDDPTVVAKTIRESLNDPEANLEVRLESHRPRLLILVSKYNHCLTDLLYRWQHGLLPVEVAGVASNHPDCQPTAEQYQLPFFHLPISKAAEGPTSKQAQEARLLELVAELDVDLVVLARYMQILSDDLCRRLAGRAINIHHSFLPGFKGAKPYHQAHARGVKLVGATAHFVTADLDEGPIIEQEVARVNHSHTAERLVELGQDTERLVLARAVRAWAEDRVLLVGDRTVVFP
jgi:formyltetrahydrofolate deformylase